MNAQGNPDAVVIFPVGSRLTTDSASRVPLANGEQGMQRVLAGGQFRDARHQLGSPGQHLALHSMAVTTSDAITGPVLAHNGAVTLDDVITVLNCTSPTPLPSPSTTRPSPSPGGEPVNEPGRVAEPDQDRPVTDRASAYSRIGPDPKHSPVTG